jgi:hypothetical protein
MQVSGPGKAANGSLQAHLEPASSRVRGDEARETLELSIVHEGLRLKLPFLRRFVLGFC